MSVGCTGKKKAANGTTGDSASDSTHIQTSEIIQSKCEEWGIEASVSTYGIYVDWNSGDDYLHLTYYYYVSADVAKKAFEDSLYGPDSATRFIHDWSDPKIEELEKEPRRQILSGNSMGNPDLFVLIQTGNQYFFFYGCGQDQVNRVRALARALDLDLT